MPGPQSRFTDAEKIAIVQEYDNRPEGETARAFSERKGIYTASISQWRHAISTGKLKAEANGHAEEPAITQPVDLDPSSIEAANLAHIQNGHYDYTGALGSLADLGQACEAADDAVNEARHKLAVAQSNALEARKALDEALEGIQRDLGVVGATDISS